MLHASPVRGIWYTGLACGPCHPMDPAACHSSSLQTQLYAVHPAYRAWWVWHPCWKVLRCCGDDGCQVRAQNRVTRGNMERQNTGIWVGISPKHLNKFVKENYKCFLKLIKLFIPSCTYFIVISLLSVKSIFPPSLLVAAKPRRILGTEHFFQVSPALAMRVPQERGKVLYPHIQM